MLQMSSEHMEGLALWSLDLNPTPRPDTHLSILPRLSTPWSSNGFPLSSSTCAFTQVGGWETLYLRPQGRQKNPTR